MSQPTRRQRRPAAKAILIWFALTFVVTQLSFGLLFDHCWHAVRFKSMDQQFRRAEAMQGACDIVALGSSRTGCAMPDGVLHQAIQEAADDTPELEEVPHVVNLAVPVGDLISSEHVLQAALHQGWKPRIVILEVLPESLNAVSNKMQWIINRQLNWKDVPRFAGEVYRAGELSTLICARLFPMYVHRLDFFDAIGDGLMDLTKKRTGARSGIDWSKNLGIANITAEERVLKEKQGMEIARLGLHHYQIGGNSAAALERLLQRCDEEHIFVCLVAVPLSKQHRELYTASIEEAFIAHMKQCCEHHSCQFLDCRTLLKEEYFLDGHHVNDQGARQFSHWFVQQNLFTAWQTAISR